MQFFTPCPNLIYIKRVLSESNLISKWKSEKIIEMEKQLKQSKMCTKSIGTQPKFKELLPYFLKPQKHSGRRRDSLSIS